MSAPIAADALRAKLKDIQAGDDIACTWTSDQQPQATTWKGRVLTLKKDAHGVPISVQVEWDTDRGKVKLPFPPKQQCKVLALDVTSGVRWSEAWDQEDIGDPPDLRDSGDGVYCTKCALALSQGQTASRPCLDQGGHAFVQISHTENALQDGDDALATISVLNPENWPEILSQVGVWAVTSQLQQRYLGLFADGWQATAITVNIQIASSLAQVVAQGTALSVPLVNAINQVIWYLEELRVLKLWGLDAAKAFRKQLVTHDLPEGPARKALEAASKIKPKDIRGRGRFRGGYQAGRGRSNWTYQPHNNDGGTNNNFRSKGTAPPPVGSRH